MSDTSSTPDSGDLMSMTPLEARFWTVRRLAGLLGVGLLIGGLIRFSDLTAYLIISIALSFIGRPLVGLCDRIRIAGRPIGSTIGAILTLVVLFTALSLLVSLFAPLISAEAGALAGLDFQGTARELEVLLVEWLPLLIQGVDPPPGRQPLRQRPVRRPRRKRTRWRLSGLFRGRKPVVALFSIAFMTFFFLKDRHLFPSILHALTPDRHMERMQSVLDNSTALLTRYFIGLAAQVAIITTVITGLLILGVPNAFLIGFLAGLLNLIPYVGLLVGRASDSASS